MNDEPRRRPGRPRKDAIVVGIDPLGRYPGTHPTTILDLQGVDHRPKPNPYYGEFDEVIEAVSEATDVLTA